MPALLNRPLRPPLLPLPADFREVRFCFHPPPLLVCRALAAGLLVLAFEARFGFFFLGLGLGFLAFFDAADAVPRRFRAACVKGKTSSFSSSKTSITSSSSSPAPAGGPRDEDRRERLPVAAAGVGEE